MAFCSECGAKIEDGSKFCPECGKKCVIKSDSLESKIDVNKNHSSFGSKKWVLPIIIGAAGLIIVGIIIAVIITSVYKRNIYDRSTNIQDEESSEEQFESVSKDISGFFGTYDGEDGGGLVICEDGTAYYYCSGTNYSEANCEWHYDDHSNKLTISLTKLHCDIYAELDENNPDELVFESDSINWETEKFTRGDFKTDTYINATQYYGYDGIEVTSKGDFLYSPGGISMIIPKHYRIEEAGDYAFFIDTTAEYNGYGASIYIDYYDADFYDSSDFMNYCDNEAPDDAVDLFGMWLDNAEFDKRTSIVIDEANTYCYYVTGVYNSGFSESRNSKANAIGIPLYFADHKVLAWILFTQNENENIDYSSEFLDTVKTIMYEYETDKF